MLPIHGLVLAGGESSRMGTDKALLPIGDRPLLAHICDILANVCQSVTVVTPYHVPHRYHSVLQKEIRIVSDNDPGKGPLGGIAAGLSSLKAEEGFAFVMACDMPGFSRPLFDRMFEHLAPSDTDGVMCPGQYFHAFYHPRVTPIAEEALRRNELKLSRFTASLKMVYVEPTVEERECFRNLNTPEDYEAFMKSI